MTSPVSVQGKDPVGQKLLTTPLILGQENKSRGLLNFSRKSRETPHPTPEVTLEERRVEEGDGSG